MGKYAVIIGVNYVKNPEAALKGCCNDARIMYDMVKEKGFEEDDIRLIVDDDDDYPSPDHVNVKKALEWLCSNRKAGDVIFLHYSGHGTQVPTDGDDEEEDSLDEAIVLEQMFLMADDDLKQYFSELPEGVRATVVMDCCHSGSMLDGENVVIEGAKDANSEEQLAESSSLLSILGGSRAHEVSENRSLPLDTICSVMSQQLGTTVEPTGSGVNGAMAKFFGGTAGKLMMKFAMSQLAKQNGSNSNAMMGMVSSMLGGGSSGGGGGNPLAALMGGGKSGGSNPMGALMGGGGGGGGGNPLGSLMGGGGSGGGNPLSSLMGGGGGSSGGGNPLSSLMGGGGGGNSSGGNPLASLMGGGGGGNSSGGNPLSALMGGGGGGRTEEAPPADDPMAALNGIMSGLGFGGTSSSGDSKPYNPNHGSVSRDVCTLITGCQADETSADVRPAGGPAFGALTKTLTDIHKANSSISYYDLVSQVRATLSKGGFKQNPCLETTESMAREAFIC